MGLLKMLTGNKSSRTFDVQVYDIPPGGQSGAGAIRGREVALWRPPVMLDAAGRTLPGIRKELVAQYLVSTVASLAKADLGPVTVDWKDQEGRFILTTLTIHAWGQSMDVLHPIAVISQPLANALEHYQAGIVAKVRELHKGHQRFDEANAMLRRASKEMEKLRDGDAPHFNDAEYLFAQAAVFQAIVLSALIPVSDGEAEQALGTRVSVAR